MSDLADGLYQIEQAGLRAIAALDDLRRVADEITRRMNDEGDDT